MVRVPTPDEEDAKRPHREREHLVQERLRIENRIEALLFTQGIRGRPSLRSWERDVAALRTGDGRALPPLLRTELDRLRRRLVLVLELIREVEADRAQAWKKPKVADTMPGKITALQRIRGIGENFAAVLSREVFYRSFGNRRQLASYVGITPMPYPERRHGPRPKHQPSRQSTGAHDHDPARLALAALSAGQRARHVVPRARRCAARGAHGGSQSWRWRASC